MQSDEEYEPIFELHHLTIMLVVAFAFTSTLLVASVTAGSWPWTAIAIIVSGVLLLALECNEQRHAAAREEAADDSLPEGVERVEAPIPIEDGDD